VSPSHHRLRRLSRRAGVLDDRPQRVLYATTDQNTLIKFDARSPERLKDIRAITGLPGGVKIRVVDEAGQKCA
jgi:hypothetical protein